MLDACRAGIVSAVFALSSKSPASAGETASAETVTVTGSPAASLRVAVTVASPPSSEMDEELISRLTVGAASSSVMVRVWGAGAPTSVDPVTVPVTVTDFADA